MPVKFRDELFVFQEPANLQAYLTVAVQESVNSRNYYQQEKYSLRQKKLEILFSFSYCALVRLLFAHRVKNPLHLKRVSPTHMTKHPRAKQVARHQVFALLTNKNYTRLKLSGDSEQSSNKFFTLTNLSNKQISLAVRLYSNNAHMTRTKTNGTEDKVNWRDCCPCHVFKRLARGLCVTRDEGKN